jgi:hypothetical protein
MLLSRYHAMAGLTSQQLKNEFQFVNSIEYVAIIVDTLLINIIK